jgi:hypothetical protein
MNKLTEIEKVAALIVDHDVNSMTGKLQIIALQAALKTLIRIKVEGVESVKETKA